MALISCPECGEKISNKAAVCIHCGYPVDTSIRNEHKDIFFAPTCDDEILEYIYVNKDKLDSNSIKTYINQLSEEKNNIYNIIFEKAKNNDVFTTYFLLVYLYLDVDSVTNTFISDEAKKGYLYVTEEKLEDYPNIDNFSEVIEIIDIKKMLTGWATILEPRQQYVLVLSRNKKEYLSLRKRWVDYLNDTIAPDDEIQIKINNKSTSISSYDIVKLEKVEEIIVKEDDLNLYKKELKQYKEEENLWMCEKIKREGELKRKRSMEYDHMYPLSTGGINSPIKTKPKSVVSSAVMGGLLAGPTGAVIGAAHGIQKNNEYNNKLNQIRNEKMQRIAKSEDNINDINMQLYALKNSTFDKEQPQIKQKDVMVERYICTIKTIFGDIEFLMNSDSGMTLSNMPLSKFKKYHSELRKDGFYKRQLNGGFYSKNKRTYSENERLAIAAMNIKYDGKVSVNSILEKLNKELPQKAAKREEAGKIEKAKKLSKSDSSKDLLGAAKIYKSLMKDDKSAYKKYLDCTYRGGCLLLEAAVCKEDFQKAREILLSISDYKNAMELANQSEKQWELNVAEAEKSYLQFIAKIKNKNKLQDELRTIEESIVSVNKKLKDVKELESDYKYCKSEEGRIIQSIELANKKVAESNSTIENLEEEKRLLSIFSIKRKKEIESSVLEINGQLNTYNDEITMLEKELSMQQEKLASMDSDSECSLKIVSYDNQINELSNNKYNTESEINEVSDSINTIIESFKSRKMLYALSVNSAYLNKVCAYDAEISEFVKKDKYLKQFLNE